jgi:hypothetical protein
LLRPELFAWFEKQQKADEEAAAKRAKAAPTK